MQVVSGLLTDALTFLTANDFTDEANTLAFIRFRRIVAANFGRELTYHLFVNTFDLDLGVVRYRDGKTRRDRLIDRVGLAQAQIEDRTLDSGTEADAYDFQFLDKSLGNTLNHVADEGTAGAVKRTMRAILCGTGYSKCIAFHRSGDTAREDPVEFTLRAFDTDLGTIDGYLHLIRHNDALITNSGHICLRVSVQVLPDEGDQFATDILLARLRTAHDTLGGGEDCNAKPTEDAGDLGRVHILAAARLGAALDVGQDRLAVGRILDLYLEFLVLPFTLCFAAPDVAFVLQETADLSLDIGVGSGKFFTTCVGRILEACEEV